VATSGPNPQKPNAPRRGVRKQTERVPKKIFQFSSVWKLFHLTCRSPSKTMARAKRHIVRRAIVVLRASAAVTLPGCRPLLHPSRRFRAEPLNLRLRSVNPSGSASTLRGTRRVENASYPARPYRSVFILQMEAYHGFAWGGHRPNPGFDLVRRSNPDQPKSAGRAANG
jgi:hypothetical protein